MFKVGDRVYHIKYGWGIIQEIAGTQASFRYKCDVLIGDQICDGYEDKVLDLELLSFTEYTLQGFSQKRQIELPEVGDWCLVRDNKQTVWQAGFFKEYRPDNEFPFATDIGSWKQIKRIKILD